VVLAGGRGLRDLVARLPKTKAALSYAEQQHAGQQRKFDGDAFILHPLEVGWLLYYAGAPDHVIAAGVLHDTLEKTTATPAELRRRFGAQIAALVGAVSEDKQIVDYHARKSALRRQVAAAGPEALMVFAADKVSKARELQRLARKSPLDARVPLARERRMIHYRHCLELLEQRLSDSPLVDLLRTELVRVERLDARRPAFRAAAV
jgi:(p)ppGpp synthase/HD superfamily hydrolase